MSVGAVGLWGCVCVCMCVYVCACLENPRGFSLCFLIPALPAKAGYAFAFSGKASLPRFCLKKQVTPYLIFEFYSQGLNSQILSLSIEHLVAIQAIYATLAPCSTCIFIHG